MKGVGGSFHLSCKPARSRFLAELKHFEFLSVGSGPGGGSGSAEQP